MADETSPTPGDALRVAVFLFDAIKGADPYSFVQGDPRRGADTLIDGTFNLVRVAEQVLVAEAADRQRKTDS